MKKSKSKKTPNKKNKKSTFNKNDFYYTWPKGVIVHNGFPFIQTPDGQYIQYTGGKIAKEIKKEKVSTWPEGVVEHNGFAFIQTPDGKWIQYIGKKIDKEIVIEPQEIDDEKPNVVEKIEFIRKPIEINERVNKQKEINEGGTKIIEKIVEVPVEKVVERPVIKEKTVEVYKGTKVVGSEDKKKYKKLSIVGWILIIIAIALAITLGLMYFFKVRAVNIDYGGKSAEEYDAMLKAAFNSLRPWLYSFVSAQAACIFVSILMFALQWYFAGNHYDKIDIAEQELNQKQEQ